MQCKLEADWKCPNCKAIMYKEECDSVRHILSTHHSQVEMRCGACLEELMADVSECTEGYVMVQELWNYEGIVSDNAVEEVADLVDWTGGGNGRY